MKRTRLALALVLVLVALASTTPAAFAWFSTRILQTSALLGTDGRVLAAADGSPLFQVSYLTDDLAPETCLAVLVNTQTGDWKPVAVPAGSCQARGAK
jgi:hypothetical protein